MISTNCSRIKVQNGYILLTVVFTLIILATLSFLLSQESAFNTGTANREQQMQSAQYVAEAGLQHAIWQLNQANCTGYTDLTNINFNDHQYKVSITDTSGNPTTSGSPVILVSTATLTNGATKTITRSEIKLYETTTSLLTLQPGSESEDTYLWDGAHKNKNFGLSPILSLDNAGKERTSLLKFDLSSLTSNMLFKSALLILYLEGGRDLLNGVLNLHRVTRTWEEGEEDDKVPDNPGATYLNYNGSNPWSNSGGDYDATVASTLTISSLPLIPWPYPWDVSSLIQKWHNKTQINNGLLLRASGSGNVDKIEFASSDAATPENRPKLEITYNCECGAICTSTP